MITKKFLADQIEGVKKDFVDYSKKWAAKKLTTLFGVALSELYTTTPVNTGQYLASFRVSSSKKAIDAGPMCSPKGAAWWSGTFDSGKSAANREAAVALVQRAYAEARREISANPIQNWFLTNGAPHSAALEYGRGNKQDWTGAKHRGLVARAWQQGFNAANLVKKV